MINLDYIFIFASGFFFGSAVQSALANRKAKLQSAIAEQQQKLAEAKIIKKTSITSVVTGKLDEAFLIQYTGQEKRQSLDGEITKTIGHIAPASGETLSKISIGSVVNYIEIIELAD